MGVILLVLLDLASPPHAPGPSAPAPDDAAPRVVARTESGRRVAIEGRHFPPGEPVELLVDLSEAHASQACHGPRSKTVTVDARGNFTTRIRVPEPDCDFRCSGDPTPFIVWVDRACGDDCRQQVTSPPFACWKP